MTDARATPISRASVPRRIVVAVSIAGLLFYAGCSTPPGSPETDRIVSVVTDAIRSPRQESLDGVIRAALATRAGSDSRLSVVEAEELPVDELVDPFARLVFRVHLDASGSGFSASEAVTACYDAAFNFYGIIDSPRRVDCPASATPIVPGPAAPQANVVIPAGFDSTLADLLAVLPGSPNTADVSALVTGQLPAPGVDPNTGLQDLSPTVEAAVAGGDVSGCRSPCTTAAACSAPGSAAM